MEPCEGYFVAEAPAECGVWPTSAAQVGPSARVPVICHATARHFLILRRTALRRMTFPLCAVQ